MIKNINYIKSYLINVLILVISFELPIIGFIIVAYAFKRNLKQYEVYASCGLLLSFIARIIELIS